MKPINAKYTTITVDDNTKVAVYVFSEDPGLTSVRGSSFTNELSDGRSVIGSSYFSVGIDGLVSKLLKRSPKPKLNIETKRPYKLGAEIDEQTIEEIKDSLTDKCGECRTPTVYSVEFITPIFDFGWGGSHDGYRLFACTEHINRVIEREDKPWTIKKKDSPLWLARETSLGSVKYDPERKDFVSASY